MAGMMMGELTLERRQGEGAVLKRFAANVRCFAQFGFKLPQITKDEPL
jgi:hypothetical protein